MKVRTLIIATALVSSILGGTAVYIALTVPNDVRAASLLKDARAQLAKGNESAAREKLTLVVQQYPRTDAAASATVALLAIADNQRDKLQKRMTAVEKETREQTAVIGSLAATVKELSSRPAPAPPPVAKPAPAKAPTVRKTTPKRTTRKAPARRTTKKKRR